MGLLAAIQSSLNPQMATQPEYNWNEYLINAQRYLNRENFQGTPLTGPMLANTARNTYQNTGVYIPIELALAQAQFETMMGTKGRNPKTNPYNVGEFDEGTKLQFKSPEEGVQAYYNLLARDYLKNNTLENLLTNFVNKAGDRYASDPNYEKKISQQISYIKGFLNKKE